MKVSEFLKEITAWGAAFEVKHPDRRTCDTVKVGDADAEIRRIAVSMFATPDVIREAARQGANLLVVHEPTFYNHWDDNIPHAVGEEKKKLIEESGLTVIRFHDHAHAMNPDMIYAGELKALGLRGHAAAPGQFAIRRYELETPMTALQLARRMEERLGIRHVRVAGCTDKPGTRLSCCFGTPGHIAEELAENDFVLTGEICEWAEGELARDYAQLGYNKAILVMSHIGSEREGMRLFVEMLHEKFPEIPAEYIECGEVYRYTDAD